MIPLAEKGCDELLGWAVAGNKRRSGMLLKLNRDDEDTDDGELSRVRELGDCTESDEVAEFCDEIGSFPRRCNLRARRAAASSAKEAPIFCRTRESSELNDADEGFEGADGGLRRADDGCNFADCWIEFPDSF